MSLQLWSEKRFLYALRNEQSIILGRELPYICRIEEPVHPLGRTALNVEKSRIYAQSELQLILILEVEYRVETVLYHYR